MRRTVSALALLLVSCAPAFAEVRFGFDIGMNISSLHYDQIEPGPPMSLWRDRHSRSAPTGGVSLEFGLNERSAIATGLRYVRYGNRVDMDDPYVTGFRITQHYLSMPILLSVRPFPSRRIFIALGPELAVLVAASTSTSPPMGADGSISNDLEPLNASLDAQAGFEFPYNDQTGLASLRYGHGLVGVAKDDRWASDWSTRGFDILLGLRW